MWVPLRGHFNNKEHQYGFKSDTADDDAIEKHCFSSRPCKHVHGQWGGNSKKRKIKGKKSN